MTSAPRVLFHGGPMGLTPGDRIAPPRLTRPHRLPGRVYLTPHLEVALMFAAVPSAGKAAGSVYEVEPVGTPERYARGDEDYLLCQLAADHAGGVAPARPDAGVWTAQAAYVAREVIGGISMTEAHALAFRDCCLLLAEVVRLTNHADQWHQFTEQLAALSADGLPLYEALTVAVSKAVRQAG